MVDEGAQVSLGVREVQFSGGDVLRKPLTVLERDCFIHLPVPELHWHADGIEREPP